MKKSAIICALLLTLSACAQSLTERCVELGYNLSEVKEMRECRLTLAIMEEEKKAAARTGLLGAIIRR